jgi:multiple sugar transport system substrate-binding protein
MKKTFALLLILLLSSGLLAFAGGAQDKAAEAETITVLMGIDAAGKHMGERAQEFTAKTGIKVNMIEVEWDTMVNKQAVALTAGEPTYDIVDCGSFMLPEYVPGGMYEDISDMFPPEVKAKYMEGMVESVTVDGKVYAAPLMASWTIMFYNSEMFEKAGLDPNKPPKTWDELVAAGKAIQAVDPNAYAYTDSMAHGEQNSCVFFRWAKSAGAKIGEFRGNKYYWMLDSDECVAAVEFLKSMMDQNVMDPGAPIYYQQQVADLFGKGHAAMLVNWDMMTIAFRDPAQSPYAGKIFPAAMPGRTPGLSGSIEGHEYMAVPSASLHKEAAKEFIKYVTSVENVKRRALEQGMTPVYKELFEDPEVKKSLPLDVIFAAAKNCYYRPAVPEYAECAEEISTELQNVMVNNKDVRQALADANDRCNELSGW